MPTDPNTLLAAARCMKCIPPGLQRAVIVSLIVQWANGGVCPVSWSPPTFVAQWHEGVVAHSGDLATFCSTANFAAVTELRLNDVVITDIDGLAALPNLQHLTLTDAQITSIDLSGNLALIDVVASSTGLLSLDLSNHPALTGILCDNSQLMNLDLHGCALLQTVHCQQCELGTLNIHNCPAITELWTYDNPQTLTNPPLNIIF